MALYDSADLLSRFRRYADRPTSDEDLSDADVYAYLTDAQIPVVGEIAALFPRLLMGAPALMSTSDNGATYTVGTDSEGAAIYPFGHAEVYAQAANGAELYGSTYGAYNGDFVFEGAKLRVPAGNTRSFSSGPYIRYVALPLTISASTEPTLQPKQIRQLVLYRGLVLWANTGGHRDPRPFEEMYQTAWLGPDRRGGLLALLTTQYRQSAQAAMAGIEWWRWWRAQGGMAQYPMVLQG